MTPDSHQQFNQILGFAGLGILVVMFSLSMAGLSLRMWHTWRLERRGAERRLSFCSTSSGGFESFYPNTPVYHDYTSPNTPVSPVTIDSFYLDNWYCQFSTEIILNTTFMLVFQLCERLLCGGQRGEGPRQYLQLLR